MTLEKGAKFRQNGLLGTFYVISVYIDSYELMFQYPYGDFFVKFESFEDVSTKFRIGEYNNFQPF